RTSSNSELQKLSLDEIEEKIDLSKTSSDPNLKKLLLEEMQARQNDHAATVQLEDSSSKLDKLSLAAAKISDDDPRLDQLLVAAGKKHFKDWPFIFEASGGLRDRREINIRCRGSLRKGILKLRGDVEIHSMDK